MSDKKKILLVDDNYESIDFFRSMLEIMDQRFSVVSTPSAEEGWLEFRRDNFDLLVTDLRLPGMSGVELIQRILDAKPGFPTILVSGYERDRLKAEIADVPVYAFLEKPYDTNQLLQLIQTAVFGEEAAAENDPLAADESPDEGPVEIPIIELDVTSEIVDTLSNLKFYTGGEQVMLGFLNGQIIHQLESSNWLDFENLAPYLAGVSHNSVLLGNTLKDRKSQTIHNLESKESVIFSANVGQRYFIALFLDNRSERGRLGVIWVAIQRVVKELEGRLPLVAEELDEAYFGQPAKSSSKKAKRSARSDPSPSKGRPEVVQVVQPPQVPTISEPEFVPLTEPIIDNDALTNLLDSDEWEVKVGVGFWDKQIEETEFDSDYLLSFEDALQQGFINSSEATLSPDPIVSDDELKELIPEKDVDWESDREIDSFWDSLIDTPEDEPKSEGAMSIEEAKRLGLLGDDLGAE
ncbi:MAG: response regulator [Chloroflexota bacterium]